MLKRLNLRQREERYPPILIRLLITRGGKGDPVLPTRQARWVPTDQHLAEDCGLTMAQFKFVSYSTDWHDITDRLKHAYLKGCEIDLEDRDCFARLEWMRRHGRFTHLRKSPLWEFQFAEQIELYADKCGNGE